jgi:hypothetical protein
MGSVSHIPPESVAIWVGAASAIVVLIAIILFERRQRT